MTNEQMLLNAAKAMGFEKVEVIGNSGVWVYNKQGFGKYWNPLESSADCADMEDALDITVVRSMYWVRCWYDGVESISQVQQYEDHTSKGAARRYASTMVAAMIGDKP